jgi:hypothetical protein
LYHPASNFYAVVSDFDQLPQDSSDLWDTVFYTLQLLDVKIPARRLILLEGRESDIHNFCDYHVILGPIKKQVFPLTSDKYFLSNISSLTLTCDSDLSSTLKSVNITSTGMVIQIPCGCFAMAGFIYIPKQTHGCFGANMSSVNVTLKHVFNLPLLKLFFEDEQLAALSGDTLLDKNLAVHLPNLNSFFQLCR